jgi:serine/threonine-protein kinase HipA
MTSSPDHAFVWVWLPDATEPIVAGRLDAVGDSLVFTYGRSYLDNPQAIPLYLPELPLVDETITPLFGTHHGCIADAAPDSWGQRVILSRRFGHDAVDTTDLTLLDYLLESGSDRVGALDFQASAGQYLPRLNEAVSLVELAEAADRIDRDLPLTPALEAALVRGSSIGGARPKVTIVDDDRRLIAKFSSTTDPHPVVEGEYVAMRLAALSGLTVASVELTVIDEERNRRALIVERFDRGPAGRRKAMVSALTVLELTEEIARYASYARLAEAVRHRFTEPEATLHELFARITFNILVSNTDDHARNHAAFWDGRQLTLTPAYDICPQRRAGGETQQVMAIGEDGWRYSQLEGCVERAATYRLTEDRAQTIIDRQVQVIEERWDEVCAEAGLAGLAKDRMRRAQFLNPYAFEGYRGRVPEQMAA